MGPLRLALLTAAVGCASTPPRVAESPQPPPATPPPATDAEATTAAVVAAPSADPCAEGTLHDALAGLGAGRVLGDARVGDYRTAPDSARTIAGLFPAVRAEGNDVLSAAPSDVLQGPTLIALVVPSNSTPADPGRRVTGPSLAVLSCRAGAGWVLAARPFSLGTESVMQLRSVRATALPEGAHGATVTVTSYVEAGESHTTAYLMGASSALLPVRLPRAATVGVQAVIGSVGELVGVEGELGYRSVVPLDATGWYPVGDEQVFVRVAREKVPAGATGWTDAIHATPLARLNRLGFAGDSGGNMSALWMVAGSGEPPAYCSHGHNLLCARLTNDGGAFPDATQPFTWVLGAWRAGSEVPRDLLVPGARWLYAGVWEGGGPPRDPNRGEPLTALPYQPNTPPPDATPRHGRGR